MQKQTKPESSSGFAQREIDNAATQFDKFEEEVRNLKTESFSKTTLADKEVAERSQNASPLGKDVYLKPKRSIMPPTKYGKFILFNEKFRADYEHDKQYVCFIAQNKECPTDSQIRSIWTKKYAGVPAEEWDVPTGVPVWGPRYLADQIATRTYQVLMMNPDRANGMDQNGQYFGQLAIEKIENRLDANPYVEKKSFFMPSKF